MASKLKEAPPPCRRALRAISHCASSAGPRVGSPEQVLRRSAPVSSDFITQRRGWNAVFRDWPMLLIGAGAASVALVPYALGARRPAAVPMLLFSLAMAPIAAVGVTRHFRHRFDRAAVLEGRPARGGIDSPQVPGAVAALSFLLAAIGFGVGMPRPLWIAVGAFVVGNAIWHALVGRDPAFGKEGSADAA